MTGRNVFFVGEASLPGDSYVNVRASSYGEMRAILMSSFQCLQRGNFVMAERQDGTLVCDDDYYQSLQADTELVVLVDNAANHKTDNHRPAGRHGSENKDALMSNSSTLQSKLATSNHFTSNLQISNIIGNVPMGLHSYPPTVRSDHYPSQHRPSHCYMLYGSTPSLPPHVGPLPPHPNLPTQPMISYQAYPNADPFIIPTQSPYIFDQSLRQRSSFYGLPVHESRHHVYQPSANPCSVEQFSYPNTRESAPPSAAGQWNSLPAYSPFPNTPASAPQHTDLQILPLPQPHPPKPPAKDHAQTILCSSPDREPVTAASSETLGRDINSKEISERSRFVLSIPFSKLPKRSACLRRVRQRGSCSDHTL
jgi:hypothetical protein